MDATPSTGHSAEPSAELRPELPDDDDAGPSPSIPTDDVAATDRRAKRGGVPELPDDDDAGPYPSMIPTDDAAATDRRAKRGGVPELPDDDDAGPYPSMIPTDDAATTDRRAKRGGGPELVGDDAPAPSAAAAGGAAAERPIVDKIRAGADRSGTARPPTPSAEANAAAGPSPSRNRTAVVGGDEEAGARAPRGPAGGGRPSRLAVWVPRRSSSRDAAPGGGADLLRRGDSAVRVPEAWVMDAVAVNARAREEGEALLVAQPLVPWWREDRTRLNAWALLCLCSVVVLAAHETDTDNQNMGRSVDTLITIYAALSLSLSAASSLAHLGNGAWSRRLVGRTPEGLAALVLAGLWAGCLPIIMDPSNGLANMYVGTSDGDGTFNYDKVTMSNASLFFFGWGAFVCAMAVLIMFSWERFGRTGGMGMWYTSKWCFLALASVITIVECSQFRAQECEGGTKEITCARNTFGLVAGYIGLVVSSFMTFFSYRGRDSPLNTTITGLVMAVDYTLLTALLCFGNGPATYVGNQYLWAWLGFFVSCSLFGNALKEVLRERSNEAAALAAEDGTCGEASTTENHDHSN